jgi:glycosyltransferase involved in cell wall biosynthesis
VYKVLLINPANDLGGVGQYLLSLVRYLPREKFEIHTAVFGNGPFGEMMRGYNVVVHQLPVNYSAATFPRSLISLRRFLKQEKFHLVHAHTAKAGLLSCFASIGLVAKVIYTGHGFRFTQKKFLPSKLLFWGFERYICSTATFVTVLSESELEFGLSKGLFDRGKARRVSMSINVDGAFEGTLKNIADEKQQLGIPPDACVVGMIGRLSYQKDPETFVRAAARLHAQLPHVRFLWVGDGELRDSVARLADRMGISKNFIMTGQRNRTEIPALLSVIDVLLFTSRFEGLPIALLEAMAARKLIVAANVGSIHEVIKDGVTGWLFDAGDDRKAAALVNDIYHNRAAFESVAEAAHKLVAEHYAPEDKMSKEFQAVYELVANGRPQ